MPCHAIASQLVQGPVQDRIVQDRTGQYIQYIQYGTTIRYSMYDRYAMLWSIPLSICCPPWANHELTIESTPSITIMTERTKQLRLTTTITVPCNHHQQRGHRSVEERMRGGRGGGWTGATAACPPASYQLQAMTICEMSNAISTPGAMRTASSAIGTGEQYCSHQNHHRSC